MENFQVENWLEKVHNIENQPFIPHFVLICECLGFSLVIYPKLGIEMPIFEYSPRTWDREG